jgi:hypothetical protein
MIPIATKNRAGRMGPEQAKKVDAFGFVTGEGGTVTQATNKSTGVTLDKRCGEVVMNNASLAASTSVSFTLTNSTIATNDLVVANISGAATANSYQLTVDDVAAGSCRIHVGYVSGGSLGEALIIGFAVIKVVVA